MFVRFDLNSMYVEWSVQNLFVLDFSAPSRIVTTSLSPYHTSSHVLSLDPRVRLAAKITFFICNQHGVARPHPLCVFSC